MSDGTESMLQLEQIGRHLVNKLSEGDEIKNRNLYTGMKTAKNKEMCHSKLCQILQRWTAGHEGHP